MFDAQDTETLRRMRVQPPPICPQVARWVLERVQPCACPDCRDLLAFLRKLIEESYGVQQRDFDLPALNLPQCGMVLQILETCDDDASVEYAQQLCFRAGQAIQAADLPARLLHELEQGQAATRDQLESARAKLWFVRSVQSIVGKDRCAELAGQIRPLNINGTFEPIRFDVNFRLQIRAMAKRFVQQVGGKGTDDREDQDCGSAEE